MPFPLQIAESSDWWNNSQDDQQRAEAVLHDWLLWPLKIESRTQVTRYRRRGGRYSDQFPTIQAHFCHMFLRVPRTIGVLPFLNRLSFFLLSGCPAPKHAN